MQEENIIVFQPPPNLTHLVQPLDVLTFACFKRIYRNILKPKPSRSSGVAMEILRARASDTAFAKVTSEVIRSSFRRAGIYPFKKDMFDKDIVGQD